jgi:hypothetical protein
LWVKVPPAEVVQFAAVVISGDEEGDRIVESPEVKVSCGWG